MGISSKYEYREILHFRFSSKHTKRANTTQRQSEKCKRTDALSLWHQQ